MSRPRAATSVATKISIWSFLKSRITRRRLFWSRSPWIPSARKPRSFKPRVNSSTRRLVRPKTIDNSGWSTSIRRVMVSNFSCSFTLIKYWSTLTLVNSLALIFTCSGSFMNWTPIRLMASGIVAEKRRVWRSSGTRLMIASISSRKPMLSISSASSKIKVSILLSLRALRLIRSRRRPGVPTTIWAPERRALICFSMLEPP